jgi:Skp family chaperone for outer membrane proteins
MKMEVILATILFTLCAAGVGLAQCSVAVIDSETFTDPHNGITVIAQAASHIEQDLQPRHTQVQQLRQRYQSIIDEISKVPHITGGNIGWLTQKVDEAKRLNNELERLSKAYEEEHNRRVQAVVELHGKSIAGVLQAIARKRDYKVILDRRKMKDAIIYVAKECDATNELIDEYNRRVSKHALSNNSLNPTPR